MSIQSNIFNLVKVNDGQDSNTLRILTSTESVLKFPKSRNGDEILYDISPSTLNISLKNIEEDVASNLYTIVIYLNENNLNDIITGGNLNRYLTEESVNHTGYVFNFEQLYNDKDSTTYISSDDYRTFLNDFFGTSFSTYIEIQVIYNELYAYKYLLFQVGTSEDAARLSIEAGGIYASIAQAGLQFNGDGLSISNGNFKITNSSNQDVLYFNKETGNLSITGNVYATSGYFNGEIHATSGEFNGIITSQGGNIGGFQITQNTIQSSDLILTSAHDNIESSIYVKNINIGTGARINEYLQIGNLKLLNPHESTENPVLQLAYNNTNYFTLKNNGDIIGNGWNISTQGGVTVANFDNGNFTGTINATDGIFQGEIIASVINASTINTANFITEEVRTMGGSFIYKPTFEIVDYEYISYDSQTELYKFKFKIDSIYTSYFSGLSTGNNLISVQGSNIRYGQFDSFNEIDGYCEVLVNFYQGDYNLLINTNNNYNSITLLGEVNTNNTIIGINSDNSNTFLSPRALQMIQPTSFNKTDGSKIGYITYNNKLILGDLSNISINNQNLSGYGLYADNVYLRGSLTTNTSDNATYAGVNTSPIVDFDYNSWNENNNVYSGSEKIIFWGGANGFDEASIKVAPFIITNKGNIYARSGKFKGAVIADSIIAHSTIQAAIIEGVGNSPSLKIYDTGNSGGIGFYKKTGDLLTLTINNTGFYHGDEEQPFIGWNEANSNIIANIYQLKTGNTSITDGIIKNGNTQLILDDTGKYAQLKYYNGNVKVTNGLVTITDSLNIINNNNQKLDYKVNSMGYYCLTVS